MKIKKILIIILLFTMLFATILNTNILGYTHTTENTTFEIADNLYALIFEHEYYNQYEEWLCYTWGNDFIVRYYNKPSVDFKIRKSNNTLQPTEYVFMKEIVYYKDSGNTKNIADVTQFKPGNLYRFEINSLFSSMPIYTDNTYTVFFFNPTIVRYKIPIIAEVQEITGIITGTMKIIIPIGLTLFGMLLLVWLIRLVILRMK